MKNSAPPHLFRILDANLNRSREGLRVCEEVSRFYMSHRALTKKLKSIRHALSDAARRVPGYPSTLLSARDVAGDVGRPISALENQKKCVADLFLANIQRSKEALRVLEETAKLISPKISARFKKLRFEIYVVEKRALSQLETLLHHRG